MDVVDEEAWHGRSLEEQHGMVGKVHYGGTIIWSRGG